MTFTPIGGGDAVSWEQSLGANYTEGILVMHQGTIVYERYFGALTPRGQHIAHSVTKSFVGTAAAMLIAEGRLDREALVSLYIPELSDSGFGDATVGHRDKVNVNGGAIALDHPIGATGAILIGMMLDELERRDVKRGLVTMCAAGGMAPAVIIERV